MQSQTNSGESTPHARFTSSSQTGQDSLQAQTIGLLDLSEFRKRRADALDQSGQESTDSGGRKLSSKLVQFKKRKKLPTGAVSFGDDDHDAEQQMQSAPVPTLANSSTTENTTSTDHSSFKKRMKPNSTIVFTPKSQSKQALAKEAKLKEALQKEYVAQQELVKATEFMLPFVFFNGKDTPGGKVRIRKGDHIWLFLERARKVGAEMAGKSNGVRKDWARISVDDLMVVRHDLILPPHFDFYYFIRNQTQGYTGALFNHLAEPPAPGEPLAEGMTASEGVSVPAQRSSLVDSALEGFTDDPHPTKVVDRRWYERNKHIYPASIWEDFDPERDYSQGGRKDREGNQMFFSR